MSGCIHGFVAFAAPLGVSMIISAVLFHVFSGLFAFRRGACRRLRCWRSWVGRRSRWAAPLVWAEEVGNVDVLGNLQALLELECSCCSQRFDALWGRV